MKTTQIIRNGKKIDFHDFTETKDAALDKLDRMESMLRAMLMDKGAVQ